MVLDKGMDSLVNEVPIRSRAGVHLMRLDSIVLNPDDGLCRDRRRGSRLDFGLGLRCAPGLRDAGHHLEGQGVTVQPARLRRHRVGPELEAGRETECGTAGGAFHDNSDGLRSDHISAPQDQIGRVAGGGHHDKRRLP